MAEAEQRRGNELEATEPAVDSLRTHAVDDPAGDDREKSGKAQADDGREEDEEDGLDPAAENKRAEASVGDGSATVTAEECVGRASGQAKDERKEIPGDRAEKAREQDLLRNHLDMNHAFADGAGDGCA